MSDIIVRLNFSIGNCNT